MTALLTDNLPLLAGAPNGIKKLRELILELAVRGKLVPQDPNDEPASELLKRIAEEKARLVAEGKIKKQKPPTEINEEEKPFNVPTDWEWVRLDSLLEKIGAGSTPLGGKQAYVSDGVKFLRSQNVWNEGLRLNDVAFIPEETHQKMSGTHVKAGDMLFNITGASIGRCAAVPSDFDTGNVSQHVTIIRPVSNDTQPFLHVVLVSQLVQRTVMDVQVGVSREGLSIGKLSQFLIPFPPEAEQHRIVYKVDELMALCDRLEAQQADAESAHAQLVQALLDSLTQAADGEDFAASWQRLAEHFHNLFTTEPSIDALKQALLQLAVMGKLVPQDASDAPASEQLKRVELEKQATFNGRNRVEKLRPADADDEKPFTLPSQWVWARLGELAVNGPSNGFSPKPASVETPYRCLTLSATTRGVFNNQCFKFVDIDTDTARKYFLKNGDLLIQRANSIDYVGVSAIYDGADDQFIFPDLIMRIKISECLDKYFIHCYLSSVAGRAYFRAHATGTQGNMPKINQGTVVNAPVPIPPLAEQHRIVAKVDQLMALCDQLKTRLTQARHFNEQLASALVEQAVA
jgi:type I restriction enzyme S subunit